MVKLFIGIDIGGTKTKVGLVTDMGQILASEVVPTVSGKKAADPIKWLNDVLRAVWDDQAAAIGLGIAGMVDSQQGIFIGGPNLPRGWRGFEFAAALNKEYRKPTVVDNDANCFALGEARFGAGRQADSLLGITLGTGIGGGIVMNGRIYRGHHFGAGEVGHIVLAGPDSPTVCPCGHHGHLEALAAGPAISRHYHQLTGQSLDAKAIAQSAGQGDRQATQVVAEAARWLGIGLASLAQTLDPEIIVLGGGLANTRNLISAASREYRRQVAYASLKKTRIVRSRLGADANLLGAASLAMDAMAEIESK